MCGRYTYKLSWKQIVELAAEMMKPYGGAIDIWEVGKDVGNV